MKHGPDIARLAALIGDPARANMLTALMSGKALTSSELANEAGITAATASSHLSKLQDADLVRVEAQGRYRYWNLSGPEVANVLETLMGLAAKRGQMRTRPGPRSPALRRARLCYDHLAGEMGVMMFESLCREGAIVTTGADLETGPEAQAVLSGLGLSEDALSPKGRRLCRLCLDWSERRHHLSGRLGASLTQRIFDLGWAKPEAGTRVVRFTPEGERAFVRRFQPESL